MGHSIKAFYSKSPPVRLPCNASPSKDEPNFAAAATWQLIRRTADQKNNGGQYKYCTVWYREWEREREKWWEIMVDNDR